MNTTIIQQVNGNEQRLTRSELDELHDQYCRAWECAEAAENVGMPWQPALERYAEEKEQVYMAAQFTNGYSWAGDKVTR